MSRTLGTVARGVRTPIFREGDNVVEGVVSSVLTALKENGIQPHDKDVAAVTESVVARCQGNYATVEQIAADVKAKTGGKTVGVTFPILSRNRFSLLLSGIAAGVEKVVLMLSYPSDEVGNHLVSLDQLDEAGIDPWHDVLDLEQFRAAFGKVIHPFTGVDYVDFYKGIIEDAGAQAEIVFANRVQTVLDYTDTVICCDIHTRQRSKRLLKKAGARVVLGLDDLLTAPVNGSGYNPQYGLLGSNKADDTRVKLFPRDADVVAKAIGQRLSEATGKRIEAMVYGDGAFKDPVGKIWELADPVVSPGYTAGLEGTPNELKLKYLADHDFGDLSGEALQQAVAQKIREKDASVSLVGNMVSEGTTPRHLTDLIGSLCDLTSGSGDKGTPVIYIQGYFDNYTNEYAQDIKAGHGRSSSVACLFQQLHAAVSGGPLFQLLRKAGRRRHVPYAIGPIGRKSPAGGENQTHLPPPNKRERCGIAAALPLFYSANRDYLSYISMSFSRCS